MQACEAGIKLLLCLRLSCRKVLDGIIIELTGGELRRRPIFRKGRMMDEEVYSSSARVASGRFPRT